MVMFLKNYIKGNCIAIISSWTWSWYVYIQSLACSKMSYFYQFVSPDISDKIHNRSVNTKTNIRNQGWVSLFMMQAKYSILGHFVEYVHVNWKQYGKSVQWGNQWMTNFYLKTSSVPNWFAGAWPSPHGGSISSAVLWALSTGPNSVVAPISICGSPVSAGKSSGPFRMLKKINKLPSHMI